MVLRLTAVKLQSSTSIRNLPKDVMVIDVVEVIVIVAVVVVAVAVDTMTEIVVVIEIAAAVLLEVDATLTAVAIVSMIVAMEEGEMTTAEVAVVAGLEIVQDLLNAGTGADPLLSGVTAMVVVEVGMTVLAVLFLVEDVVHHLVVHLQ